jgi:hypothetical protein
MRQVGGYAGLGLSLVVAVLTWGLCLAVLRKPTVRLALRVFRRA